MKNEISESKSRCEKGGMAFVEVITRRLDPKFSKNPDAADAEYFFLNDPRFGITAVEMPGNQSVNIGIFIDICVQKVKRNASDLRKPRLCMNFAASDVYHFQDLLAVSIGNSNNAEV